MDKEILCTLGPASLNDKVIARLEDLGVAYFRINMSHTKLEDLAGIIKYLQSRTNVTICLDSEGAQIRTGRFAEGQIVVEENSIIKVPNYEIIGNKQQFNLYPNDIIEKLEVGDFVSIDFNSVLAQVLQKDPNEILLRVLTGGIVGQNKAVSVDREIELPALTEKDRQAMLLGREMGIRCVALSFANYAADVKAVRDIMGPDVFIISKIESRNGVRNLEDIAALSDALLIDRGDLSRQIPIEQIPKMQKEIIDRTKKTGKKIYVATNLLESMITNQLPTRAEVNDIFNTLQDGADGLVLAAETAIGKYPINCAVMVSKMIKQISNLSQRDPSLLEELDKMNSFLLVEPHGQILVDKIIKNPDREKIDPYKSLEVDLTAILDAEQIAIGAFSPLRGFMNKQELESVLHNYKLPNGVIWPLPILLQLKQEQAQILKAGEKIALTYHGEAYATILVDEIYRYNLDVLAKEMFGTRDNAHPGVCLLKEGGEYFIGGEIELLKRLPSPYKHYELTPRQSRAVFENKGWSRVIGFHTRNVIHRAHEHIQMRAFEKYHCDGLFLHPVIGPKKKGDYSANMILKSYEIMVDRYYPKGKALLAAFQNYSRYCGPREAVFTALCRKNYGCSHFIVGRDHTGVGGYYAPDDAQKLFESLGDIGIAPVFCNEVSYCKKCGTYVESCEHDALDVLRINGTQARNMLQRLEAPPEWFARKDISDLVLNAIKNGQEVFIS